jgi:glycosyltransferase involved in cell wall biosynthesis
MQAYWQHNNLAVDRIKQRQAYLGERLERVGAIISPSHFLRDIYVQAGIPGDRIIVSRQGNAIIDRGLHHGFRKKPTGKLRAAYLGQIIELKGVHEPVEAARLIRDSQLEVKIYGDATRATGYAEWLRAAIGSDPRITLAGQYAGIDGLSDILAEADVIVVPSLWDENSPGVLLEAFALKTPAIVSGFGGMAELVQDGASGLHFRLGDPVDLAGKLQLLLDSPETLKQITASIPEVRSVADEIAALEATYGQVLTRS